MALRMSRTVFSALSATRSLARLIVDPPMGYDEPEILSYAIRPFCPTSADELHLGATDHDYAHSFLLNGFGGGLSSTRRK